MCNSYNERYFWNGYAYQSISPDYEENESKAGLGIPESRKDRYAFFISLIKILENATHEKLLSLAKEMTESLHMMNSREELMEIFELKNDDDDND